jgi:hypothetical protein
MARKLRWASLVTLLSLPVIMFLGRPVTEGCPPERPMYTPCDPLQVSPAWVGPALLMALALAILILLAATFVGFGGDDSKP